MSYYQGDYYMAGGFFKRIGRAVSKGVRFATRAASNPLVRGVVTAVNPALGIGMTSISQGVGRVSQMLSPAAAPAGLPMEGTPPAATYYQQATYGGMDPQFMQLLMMMMMQQMMGRRR